MSIEVAPQAEADTLYTAIREALATLADVPEGESATVDKAFNLLHDAYWSECPCPADRPQRRAQEVAEAA